MKPTLYVKTLLCYLLFGILAFAILCTYTQHSINIYLERCEAQQLYRESVQIASDYASNFINNSLSLEDFQAQMEALGTYLSADIWVVDNQGPFPISIRQTSGTAIIPSELFIIPFRKKP